MDEFKKFWYGLPIPIQLSIVTAFVSILSSLIDSNGQFTIDNIEQVKHAVLHGMAAGALYLIKGPFGKVDESNPLVGDGTKPTNLPPGD